MGKSICKNISKNLSSKYSQNLFDYDKRLPTDALQTASKTAIQKIAEETCDLIGNKIANRITKVSNILQQNYSEAVTNKHNKEIPKNLKLRLNP